MPGQPSIERLLVALSLCFLVLAGHQEHQIRKEWYNSAVTEEYNEFLDRVLAPYQEEGLAAQSVTKAMKLGACQIGCKEIETSWNSHFQIVGGQVYIVGGVPRFWNEHHRKRVKSTFTLLTSLVEMDPQIPDVEFVVNFHDYNKLMRRPEKTSAWGQRSSNSPIDRFFGRDSGNQSEGSAGGFHDHTAVYEGHDWELHYRIYGNHFGNAFVEEGQTGEVQSAIFSATSCAFSYDISFPTTFYDFDLMDDELGNILNETDILFGWEDKTEKAYFRGSCWYYKNHGRTAAFTMSEVAPEMVDAAWYDEIRTDMLEKDGIPQFGDFSEAGAYKYLLHLEGHDFWSMRIRNLAFVRSLLLKQQLPCEEFYYGLFKPYEHYVPVKKNLEDLYETILWARANDDDARVIADNLVRMATTALKRTSVLQYVHMLLHRYSRLLRYKMAKHPDAVPVDPRSECLSTVLPCVGGRPLSV